MSAMENDWSKFCCSPVLYVTTLLYSYMVFAV